MRRLNYHHLLYFWTVARVGSVGGAAAALSLTQPTVSGQIRVLEETLGERLFERSGRRLELTEAGRHVFGYAEEIFALGRELIDTLDDRSTRRPHRLAVGVADGMPRSIARRLIEPALRLPEGVQLVCRVDRTDRLLAALSVRELDVVLADAPVGPGLGVRAFSHLLGESDVTVFGTRVLAQRLRRQFPKSLDQAPMLVPASDTSLRWALDQAFSALGIRPRITGETADGALLESLGQAGAGVFAAASIIERDVCRQLGVQVVGRLEQIRQRFYAITLEKRLKQPAFVAIAGSAPHQVFGAGGDAGS